MRSELWWARPDDGLHEVDLLLHPERQGVPVDARRLVRRSLLTRTVQADVEVGVGGAVLLDVGADAAYLVRRGLTFVAERHHAFTLRGPPGGARTQGKQCGRPD